MVIGYCGICLSKVIISLNLSRRLKLFLELTTGLSFQMRKDDKALFFLECYLLLCLVRNKRILSSLSSCLQWSPAIFYLYNVWSLYEWIQWNYRCHTTLVVIMLPDIYRNHYHSIENRTSAATCAIHDLVTTNSKTSPMSSGTNVTTHKAYSCS